MLRLLQERSAYPTEIRGSKLYNHTIGKRTDAFQDRHSKIIDSDEVIGQKWKPNLPDFSNTKNWWPDKENQKANSETFSCASRIIIQIGQLFICQGINANSFCREFQSS